MGFFVVIINAIAIWLTSVIAPIKIADRGPATGILWIIVAAGLYTLAPSTVAGRGPRASTDRT